MIALLITIPLLASCTSLVLKTVVKTVDPYFHGKGIDGTKFEQLTDNIYTFRWNWYRNIIIDTSEGLVVIDPMNPKMTTELSKEIARHFPNK